jgi:2-methylcitrate dehydratase PrpD
MIKIYACNGGSHWAQAALHNLMDERPIAVDDIESIDVYIHEFLMSELPYHLPRTGLEAKFSVEYALATIAIDRQAGVRQFTDEMVQRPAAQELMKRINVVETFGPLHPIVGHVALTLRNGVRLEGKADTVPGKPESPLSVLEITEKFRACSSELVDEARREQIADTVWNLESLGSLGELGDLVR